MKREAEDPLDSESKKAREEDHDVAMKDVPETTGGIDVKQEPKASAAAAASDSDDDKPLVSLKKAKETPAKVKEEKKPASESKKSSKKKVKSDDEDDDDEPIARSGKKKTASKKSKKKDSESDDDKPIMSKKKEEKKSSSKKKTTKKAASESEGESSESDHGKKKKGSASKSKKETPKKARKIASESEEDEDEKPKRKSATKKKAEPKKKKVETDDDDEDAEEAPVKKSSKKRVKSEGDEPEKKKKKKEEVAEFIYDWWNHEDELPEGVKWRFFEHHGCSFPPAYESHGVKMLYDGKPMDLSLEAEEIATWYTGFAGSDYLQKPKFIKNFWEAFSPLVKDLGITKLDKCDFQPIIDHFAAAKEAKKEMSKEDKNALKAKRALEDDPYKVAVMDGHLEPTGNFRIEPPGLFRGRGDHPKMGTAKPRIQAEDVSINVSQDACVPVCPIPGHAWKKVEHKNDSTWLCNIGPKYVFLAAASSLKGKSDRSKFEVARKLKNHIEKVREQYTAMLKKGEAVGVVLWLIDNLALRVGNEKDTDEEADTVGACSLRVEHVTVDLSDTSDPKFTLDFLGKDSIRYHNEIGNNQVRDHQRRNLLLVCENLQKFMRGKKKTDEIFSGVDPSNVNSLLKTMIEGLPISAKVFRTFNASITLVEQIEKLFEDPRFPSKTSDAEKLKLFNDCNFQVAKLCNHSKAKAKNFDEQVAKVQKKIEEINDKIAEHKKAKKSASGSEKENLKKKIEKLEEQIKKESYGLESKEKLSEVALGTSKINYIDPRITVAFCKRVNLPIERIFTATLRKKFTWAMQEADEDWSF